jgi:hypothetical protein
VARSFIVKISVNFHSTFKYEPLVVGVYDICQVDAAATFRGRLPGLARISAVLHKPEVQSNGRETPDWLRRPGLPEQGGHERSHPQRLLSV